MMIRCIAICVASLIASGVQANEPPPVPEGGLSLVAHQPCKELESGEKGYCIVYKDKTGRLLLTFWQSDVLMLIREIRADSYTNIWMNDKFNSF